MNEATKKRLFFGVLIGLTVGIVTGVTYQNSKIEHLKNIIALEKQFLSTKKDKESIAQKLLLDQIKY
jgi:gas vesicle protein